MVYKKYIKKNGKVFGPYIYHSKRVNGKVVSEYHGPRKFPFFSVPHIRAPKKTPNFRKVFYVILGVFLLVGLVYGLIFFNTRISAKAILGIDANYQEGEPLQGALRLSLKQGELIPASSKLIFETPEQKYEYNLNELVSVEQELAEGDFYVEGKSISGTGSGYGVLGEKAIYPNVQFSLNVYSQATSEEVVDEGVVEEELPPEEGEVPPEEELPPEEVLPEEEVLPPEEEVLPPEEEVVEEVTGEVVEEEPVEEVPAEEEVPVEEETPPEEVTGEAEVGVVEEELPPEEEFKPSPITGQISTEIDLEDKPAIIRFFIRLFRRIMGKSISGAGITGRVSLEVENKIDGETSFEESFTLTLSENQTAEIIPGSVRIDSEELPDEAIELSIDGGEVIVTTDYSKIEQGFGNDYIGEARQDIVIDLSELDLVFEQGDLQISLVYEEQEMLSLTAPLQEGAVSVETEEIIAEVEDVNVTEKNVTINITKIEEINVLSEEERAMLIKEFGNVSVKTTKAEIINERLIVRYELGNYWIEYSYDSNLAQDVLESLIGTDRIKWLKDIAKQLSKEKQKKESEEVEELIGNYTI